MPRGAYARIKHQLRSQTIAAIEEIGRGADPLLASWLDPEAAAASRAVLRGDRGP